MLRTAIANSGVDCILRAKTLRSGKGPEKYQEATIVIAISIVEAKNCLEKVVESNPRLRQRA